MAITKATSNVLADNAALNNLNAGSSIAFTKNLSTSGTLTVTGNTSLTGNLTVDTSTLFVNSVNNRVGIGTATPTESLTILYDDNSYANGISIQNTNAGTGNVAGMTLKDRNGINVGAFQYVHSNFINASLRNTVIFGSIGLQKLGFIANAGGSIGQDIYFQTHSTQSTPQILIQGSTDNVGIGTATPSEKLTVSGNLSASGVAYAGGAKLAAENFAVAMAIALG